MSNKGFIKTFDIGDGRTVTIETGRLAKQADGSVVVRMGDAMLLATVVSSRQAKEGADFLPLSVDYQEKFPSMGKFPGGFLKRESRLSESDILTSRNLWRTTQIGRQIQETIQQDADSMPEPLDAEYARQSIWLVTHIALVRLKELQDGATLTLTQPEQLQVSQEINAVRAAVASAYEAIKVQNTPIAETFVDVTCLRAMKAAAMQALQARK